MKNCVFWHRSGENSSCSSPAQANNPARQKAPLRLTTQDYPSCPDHSKWRQRLADGVAPTAARPVAAPPSTRWNSASRSASRSTRTCRDGFEGTAATHVAAASDSSPCRHEPLNGSGWQPVAKSRSGSRQACHRPRLRVPVPGRRRAPCRCCACLAGGQVVELVGRQRLPGPHRRRKGRSEEENTGTTTGGRYDRITRRTGVLGQRGLGWGEEGFTHAGRNTVNTRRGGRGGGGRGRGESPIATEPGPLSENGIGLLLLLLLLPLLLQYHGLTRSSGR